MDGNVGLLVGWYLNNDWMGRLEIFYRYSWAVFKIAQERILPTA